MQFNSTQIAGMLHPSNPTFCMHALHIQGHLLLFFCLVMLFVSALTVAPQLSILGVSGISLSHLSRCFLNVYVFTFLIFCSLYGNALYNLSICLAMECCIIVLYLLFIVVGTVADLIHLCLPSLPVLSFSTFYLTSSSCCQAFIMRNRSLLLSRLYIPNFLSLS